MFWLISNRECVALRICVKEEEETYTLSELRELWELWVGLLKPFGLWEPL
jgi:hypothetical protein